MSVALITGITGQDGSYLAEFLLKKGYHVIGTIRRSSANNLKNISEIKDNLQLEYGDITDPNFINALFMKNKIDECYNLAAQSFVPLSWSSPKYTIDVNAGGVLNILEAIKTFSPRTKFYQASTSEMFGKVLETPQSEKTPFYPRSPYGVSKVSAYWLTVNYRESYNLFASTGILFNHESERRPVDFVTRKITNAVARIKFGLQQDLHLGNLSAERDWGYAPVYVEYMWKILQQDIPDTFVIGTGIKHSVLDFCRVAFDYVGLDYRDYIILDTNYLRPAEVDRLLANPTKAEEKLQFSPGISFVEMVERMVDNDIKEIYESYKVR